VTGTLDEIILYADEQNAQCDGQFCPPKEEWKKDDGTPATKGRYSIFVCDRLGSNGLHYAVFYRKPAAVMEYMLKIGFGVDDENICCSSLHIASVNGDVERVEWLIRNGATINTRTKRCLFPPICLGKWTPRDLAALCLAKTGD
jgi:hypothetical protein